MMGLSQQQMARLIGFTYQLAGALAPEE